jgi:hypothetical protein
MVAAHVNVKSLGKRKIEQSICWALIDVSGIRAARRDVRNAILLAS